MEFTHDKYGKCVLIDLTQKGIEDFHKTIRELNGKDNVTTSLWRGNSVRACAKLSLMTEPELKPADIDDASPGLIVWLSECIGSWQAEALGIDPLS